MATHRIYSDLIVNGAATLQTTLLVTGTASFVDDLLLGDTGTAGTNRELTAQGSETDIHVDVIPKGVGLFRVPTSYEDNIGSEGRAIINKAYHDANIGGVAANLSDPGADRIVFWDESEGSGGELAFLSLDSSLAITGTTLAVVTNTSVQQVAARLNSTGGDVGTRRRLNFIEGTGIDITITDDAGDDELDITITNTGAGSGTVTSFSAGNLSPLFTTNVADPSTTPVLTFALVNQNANLIYGGPATGVPAAPTFRSLVTADFPDNGITNSKLRDSAATSVIGRSANSSGDPGDISAGTDGFVLRRSGTTLGFGTLGIGSITMNTARLLGRTTASAGAVEEISIGAGTALTLNAGVLSGAALGTDGQVPYMNSAGTDLSYSSKFTWDNTNNNLTAAEGTTLSGTNNIVFGLNATVAGDWNFSACESGLIRSNGGAGGAGNAAMFGFGNEIGDGVNAFSGHASLVFGAGNKAFGRLGGLVGGATAQIDHSGTNAGGVAIAFGVAGSIGTGGPVRANAGAGNISRNDGSQTAGHGALAQDSFILGGINGNIPSTSPRSIILGGNAIKARAADADEVYVPNLNIVTTPANDDALTQILARDNATGEIKYRAVSSISGAVASATVSINSAEVLNINSSPKEIIAAPGASKFIKVIAIVGYLDFNTAAYATNFQLDFRYNNTGTSITSTAWNIAQSEDKLFRFALQPTATGEAVAVLVNQPITLSCSTGNPTTGDGTLKVYISYEIVDL